MQERTQQLIVGRMADARGERENVMVTLRAGKIADIAPWNVAPPPQSGDVDARDGLLLPGFIDIHVHGGAGRYVMDGTGESLEAIAVHLARHGVTGFLSTTVTGPRDLEASAVSVAARRMRTENERGKPDGGEEPQGATVLGVHLEGPSINPVKKGAQPEEYIRTPSADDFRRDHEDYLTAIKVVTIAPEMPGALELIRFFAANGIVASLGHTNATYDEVSAAIDAGAHHVTHCFNAMRPLDSREPGVVGAALARPELMAELIWDGIHVHPASCRALINAKSANGVILISDGVQAAGMPDGYEFALGTDTITARNGVARLADGTLAGSLLTLDRAFANATPFTLSQRSAMSSRNAAVALGLGHRKGLLAPGYDADLVLLNPDGSVRQTFVAGRAIYTASN